MKIKASRHIIPLLFATAVLLSGCSFPGEREERSQAVARLEEQKAKEETLKAERLQKAAARQEKSYAFGQLEASRQKLYVEILSILEERRSEEEIDVSTPEEIEPVFQCVMNDHPELFYVDGYTYTKYTAGERLEKITFTGTYTMNVTQEAEKKAQMEAVIQGCLAGVPEGADEYGKVKYVYEYIIDHTEYDRNAPDNQNICSVFLNGRSICQGYAKAVQYLLQRLGVYATLVTGSVNGEGHAWNLVRIDGAYYYVDATWGDASYRIQGEDGLFEQEESVPSINYDYLCVTTDQLLRTHSIDDVVKMPECTAMDANYYVKEGAYFESVDSGRIRALFDRAYEQNQGLVTLKCSDESVYWEMWNELISQQEIFRYLKDSGTESIAYIEGEEQLSLSFWL